MEEAKKKRRRQFQMDTKDDVLRCLKHATRKLRSFEVTDEKLDPIRLGKAKELRQHYALLAKLMDEVALNLVSDDALRAEVLRRAELEESGTALPGAPH